MKCMIRVTDQYRRRANNGGFSLVEVLVASVILAIIVIGVLTAMRKGAELDTTYTHHRKAMAVINSCFEDTLYTSANFSALADTHKTVLIDNNGTAATNDDLIGTLTIDVSDQQFAYSPAGRSIHYKQVSGTLQWQEADGVETIDVTKCIAGF